MINSIIFKKNINRNLNNPNNFLNIRIRKISKIIIIFTILLIGLLLLIPGVIGEPIFRVNLDKLYT